MAITHVFKYKRRNKSEMCKKESFTVPSLVAVNWQKDEIKECKKKKKNTFLV